MDVLQRVISYCRYLYKARSHQRIHSPFVFEFARKVLYSKTDHEACNLIEARRQQLLQDHTEITVTDLGAGAAKWGDRKRKISDIAKTSLKREKYAQLIFRIARHYQPKSTLELGTSFGITSAYIGQGYPGGQVFTIEGCPSIARVARQTFEQTRTKNIRLFTGHFDDVLPEVLSESAYFDIIFIDGNHAYEPTLRYFERCLSKAHNNTVFIFDDIHWSKDMERAWKDIQDHPLVTITIDIYEMGLVFIRNENRTPEHFVIKY